MKASSSCISQGDEAFFVSKHTNTIGVDAAAAACFPDVGAVSVSAGQVINNRKVTDHHAIIPTKELQKCTLSELPIGEVEILKLIVQRLLTAVSEPCKIGRAHV